MTIIFLRILACAVMLVLPFALLAMASGKAEGLIWLIFPIVLAVPALALLALVLVPVEAVAAANGASKNVAAIAAGAVGAAAIWLGMLALQALSQGKPILTHMTSGVGLKTTLVWMLLGALLGGLWRASEWLVRYLGWAGHG